MEAMVQATNTTSLKRPLLSVYILVFKSVKEASPALEQE